MGLLMYILEPCGRSWFDWAQDFFPDNEILQSGLPSAADVLAFCLLAPLPLPGVQGISVLSTEQLGSTRQEMIPRAGSPEFAPYTAAHDFSTARGNLLLRLFFRCS